MIVANYTPDDIEYVFGGITGTVKSGQLRELSDAAAKHILNKFDRRGLLQLRFGDKPEEKQAEALALWKRFWTRQVVVFNQDNERRKNTNREYVEPTQELLEHSKRLGIEVIGPWSVKENDNEALKMLRDENFELKTQLNAVMSQVQELVGAMKARGDVPVELRTAAEKVELSNAGVKIEQEPEKAPEPDPDVADLENARVLINEFQMLNREKFGDWVVMNLDRLQSPEYPPAVLAVVKEKWERLLKADFPLPV